MTRRSTLHSSIGVASLLLATSATVAADEKKSLHLRSEDGTVLVAADQIVAYDWPTHTLTLKKGVRDELLAKTKRHLAGGQIFVAAIGGEEIYQGRLTSLFSSASFSTPVIVLDEAAMLRKRLAADQVRIGLGYPGEGAFKGKDPRGDPRIRASLEAGGKLRIDPLEYVKLLQEKRNDRPSYCPGVDGPSVVAVRQQDVPELVKLLDSNERCSATVLPGSSAFTAEGSTVGHEAAVLLDSLRLGKPYPIASISTKHQVDRKALLKWRQDLDGKTKEEKSN
jgi:hypothetical protein